MANVETKHETVLDAGTIRARLARVYAEALLANVLAQSPSEAEAVGAELVELSQAAFANANVGAFLGSPIIAKKVRTSALATAVTGRASRPVQGLLAVLAKNNRLSSLRGITQAYTALLNERAGRAPVKVTTAVPLSDEQRKRLATALKSSTGKDVEIKVVIDPTVLGGVITQIGDTVIDGSVRHRLNRVRETLG
jgi:F-type H+-transporting ATPase subunit delta